MRADLGIKIFGDDFDTLIAKGAEIQKIVESIQGAADVNTEQITGQPMLQIKVDQEQVARYGISAQAVLDLVESIGSKPLGDVIEGQLRFPLVAACQMNAAKAPNRSALSSSRPLRANAFPFLDWHRLKSSVDHPRSPANGDKGASP